MGRPDGAQPIDLGPSHARSGGVFLRPRHHLVDTRVAFFLEIS
jgi:hypothetical protein